MIAALLICTYGDAAWENLGRATWYAHRDHGFAFPLANHLSDGTLAESRNAAAAKLPGFVDWLCFLDADDALDPGYLPAMKAAAPADGYALLVPAVSYQHPGYRSAPEIPSWGRSLLDINCAVVGTLIQRRLFHALGGFRDDLAALEDWDLWLRASVAGARLVPVPDAHYLAAAGRHGSRNADQSLYQSIRGRYERPYALRYGSPA